MTTPLKTVLWTVALMSPALAGTDAGELRATIRNVKPNQGRLMVALYDSAAAHTADRPRATRIAESAGAELVVVFSGLPPAFDAFGVPVGAGDTTADIRMTD